MLWRTRGLTASIVASMFLAFVFSSSAAACPSWGYGRTHECGREHHDGRHCGHWDQEGPVTLEWGVVEITLPPEGGDIYVDLEDTVDGPAIVVYLDSSVFTFDPDAVWGFEVDARATIPAGVPGEFDVSVFLDFWSPAETYSLEFKGGRGVTSIFTDGDADINGGSGAITGTFGVGRVDVDAGTGALYLDLGSGYSNVTTGSGGGRITGTSGGWGIIKNNFPDVTDLDVPGYWVVLPPPPPRPHHGRR